MRRRIIGTLSARVELLSGMDIIFDPRYFAPGTTESLLTDYGRIVDYSEATHPEGTLVLVDDEAVSPSVSGSGRTVLARGPFRRLEREMPDKRFTLLGNQGLLYRYFLYVLERFHGVFSFHANALYDRSAHTVTVVLGGAASGKSPALLAGVTNGREVLGTELVHVGFEDGAPVVYRSSTIDNLRASAVTEDFPELLGRVALPGPGECEHPSGKFALDLTAFGCRDEAVRAPRLRFLVPKVEAGRARPIREAIGRPGFLRKLLFDNASEKIAASFTMYNAMAAPGFDTPELAAARFAFMERLAAEADVLSAEVVLAPPRFFLEVL